MKLTKFIALASIALAPLASFATGLSFSTVSNEILQADGSALPEGSLVRFGTLSSTAGSTITDFEANFTQLISFQIDASGDLTALVAPGNEIAGNVVLYGIAYGASTSGADPAAVFLVGTTPSPIGLLVKNPGNIDGSGSMLLGTHDGTNIRLNGNVVPEPSSYALIAGALGLGWVMLRRRK